MDIEKKRIHQASSSFNKHLEECDVFNKGAVLISFCLMLNYLYLNISYHTKKKYHIYLIKKYKTNK